MGEEKSGSGGGGGLCVCVAGGEWVARSLRFFFVYCSWFLCDEDDEGGVHLHYEKILSGVKEVHAELPKRRATGYKKDCVFYISSSK